MQLPGAVLLGLQVINEKRDWTVWSLSYQFGHQLLQDQSKAESSWMSAGAQAGARSAAAASEHVARAVWSFLTSPLSGEGLK